jgi:hypothetical protein
LATAIATFAAFTGAYLAMGADGAFKPGSYDVSMTWIALSFGVGIAAAALGGFVCAKIARTTTPVKEFVGLIVVFGAISAVMAFMQAPVAEARGPEVGNMEAMTKAVTPGWVAAVNVVVGVVGIVIGAKLGGKTLVGAKG